MQAMCKQYRVPLFLRMHHDLAADGIDLRVAYSAPAGNHAQRSDDADLPPEIGTRIPATSLLRGRLLLQLPLKQIAQAEVVIVEHAVKHLLNFPLLLSSMLSMKKLAFWVHGGPLRHPSSPLLRPLRKASMLRADWLFTYTQGVADALVELGADSRRITALQNAIDLADFRNALGQVTEVEIAGKRAELGIPADGHVALFCGSLYPGRGADFLVQSGERIAARDPKFHLIVIGSGPQKDDIAEQARSRPWLHYLGSVFGDRRAVFFRMAQLSLMPYLAGLGILDAMAAGLPYIVTGARSTNPEIEYLVEGVTGITTGDSMQKYADAVDSLLRDEDRLARMSEASREASHNYSIENMAANFERGIRACLANRQRA